MTESHFKLFIKLYLIGKQIQCVIKNHNQDKMADALILMLLSEKPMSVSEIACTTGIKISAMSTHVNLLEKSGLLKRETGKDLRQNVAAITQQGKIALRVFKDNMHEKYKEQPNLLTETEADQLLILLSKIHLEGTCPKKK